MKVFIIIASFVAVAAAGKTHYAAAPVALAPLAPIAAPLASTGSSSQFRSEDNYGNFNFGYDESHASGATSRREEQLNGVRRGSYSLSDADGRRRLVNYIADATGFHATIETNEPGVEPKDPANVQINKAAPVVVAAPAPIVAAPAPIIAAPAPLPAPIAAPAVAVKGYYSAPAAVAPVAVAVEAETPRAFSYSFGATHLAPTYAAPAPVAPIAAPALPLPAPQPAFWQQRIAY